MNPKKLYDNTYIRIGALTTALTAAGPYVAEYQPNLPPVGQYVTDFQEHYRLSDSQLCAIPLILTTIGWGAIGCAREGKHCKLPNLEDKLETRYDILKDIESKVRITD